MHAELQEAAVALQIAVALHRAGNFEDAEHGYRRVLNLDPANHDALSMLGMIAYKNGDREGAARLVRAAVAIQPTARHWYNLGVVLEGDGDIPGAVAAYRWAAQLDPSDPSNWASAIFAADLHPYATPETRLAERRAFNRQYCQALTLTAEPHTNDRDLERRLRVGYVSGDFFDHSAALVFGPVLEGHDPERVEITCYWQQRTPEDAFTARFKALAARWRVISTLSYEQLADQIRADEIDILVDLSGYSNGFRLPALARKPAPIIMTGWGHMTGLGIDACDYLLADAITVPPGHQQQHHEQILRLPCLMAFDPRPPYPDVAPPPREQNGSVTFGYCGRASKTSEQVWATWAKILHRVPGSRLILKGADYGHHRHQLRLLEFFASLRISSQRLQFMGSTDRAGHLAAYAGIDVALEPWPQGGGVTTLEACLMGVPSVAMLGDHLNGRVAASILATLGRPFWVAADTEHYVEIAVLMAQTAATLEDRQGLRASLLDSIICQPRAYAAAVEDRYRQAWRAWCAVDAERPALTLVEA